MTTPLQFEAFAESMHDALIVAQSDDLIAYASPVAEKMFGFGPGQLLGQKLAVLIPERYQAAHLEGMRRLTSGQPARIVGRSVQLEAIRRDGSEFPIELSLSSWHSDDALFFGAIIRDITEPRAAALRERTLHEVSRTIAESESLVEGVTRVIETVCHLTGWQIGTTWLFDPRSEQLRCIQYCDIHGRSASLFEKMTRELKFAPGIGLPGQVYEQRGPIWIADLAGDALQRAATAAELGLRSAIAFPIFNDMKAVGVIEFFSLERRVPDEKFLTLMTAIGHQLGALLNRSRSMEAVTSIIEQMQVGVLVYRLENPADDRSLRMIAVNPAACAILAIEPESVIGRTIDDCFPALRASGIPQAYRDVVIRQQPFELDHLFYTDERIAPGSFSVKAFPLPNDCVGVEFENVTDRRISEQLISGERQLLEDVAGSTDVDDILMRIVRFVEQQSPGVKAAIFRMEENGQSLVLAAAPSFSPELSNRFSRIPAGAADGCSSTAVYRREIVVVEDIEEDPLFAGHLDVARSFAIRACWSIPIIQREGSVLGTLTMYFSVPRRPDAHHRTVFEFATRIAAMVLEKSEVDRELRAGEERLRALLQYSADAVLLLDADGTVRYRSPAAQRLLGYRDEDAIGRSAFGIVHPDQREWATSAFVAATKGKELVTRSFRGIREDGAVRWFEVTISNQLDQPSLKAMVVNYRDITDRVEAADRLWQQEEQYRAIFEGVTDSILILDLAGRVVTANIAACEMHGYTLHEIVGKAATDLVRSSDHQKLAAFAAQAAAGESFYAEAVDVRKDGGEVHVVINGTAFLMGGVPHLLAVISNVSDQKRMQQRLERADRISSLGRLAATIAHEMNNVMMGIMPFTEVISRRSQNDPMLENAAAHIIRSVERGKVVTQEILRFTRATEPVLTSLNGSQLLRDLDDELRTTLDRTIVLDSFCEEDLYLFGDAAQLQQVITNLVMNAQDAMPTGGRMGVRLVSCSPEAFTHFGGGGDRVDDYAHLCVSDSGHGIPAHILGHIFEPLFTTKGGGGTGLGLAIVHQIVMAHEGQIHVESDPLRGTTFHLLLKKSSRPAEKKLSADTADDVWRRIRSVVLVEDEPSVGEGISLILRMEGVDCEWITSGGPAVERLRVFRPDLLILDVGLPDMSGMDVYRQVAELYPDLPTIFSTGHGDHRMLEELDPAAPVGFLSKPYAMETLARRVQTLLDERDSDPA